MQKERHVTHIFFAYKDIHFTLFPSMQIKDIEVTSLFYH